MKQEFNVFADKADEREQLLENKLAQLQEDLERLDAENHDLLEENKHLNGEKLKVEPMMEAMAEQAHDDKTQMMELQQKVNDLEKYEKYVKDLEKYADPSALLRARW